MTEYINCDETVYHKFLEQAGIDVEACEVEIFTVVRIVNDFFVLSENSDGGSGFEVNRFSNRLQNFDAGFSRKFEWAHNALDHMYSGIRGEK